MDLSGEQRAAIAESQRRTNLEQIALGGREANEQRTKRGNRVKLLTDWRAALSRNRGKIEGSVLNIMQSLRLAPELQGLVRFNEFALCVEFTRSPSWRQVSSGETWNDTDDLHLQVLMQHWGIPIRARGDICDSVAAIAQESAYHPIREHLHSIGWDMRPRLDHWLIDFLGAEGPEEYLRAVGSKFLISAVARVMKPGCQADHVLVLEGPQGGGKSSVCRTLAGPAAWFTDAVPDVASKDAAIQLCGRWVVELAELASLRNTQVEPVKAFITRTQDVYRPPYGRRTVTVPRQCVFIATTNEQHYLRDQTGNRRFWPVKCGQIDLAALAQHRDQILAEAYSRYHDGESWHLDQEQATRAAHQQSDRMLVTELEAAVAEYVQRMAGQGHTELTMTAVLCGALHLDSHSPDYVERAGKLGGQVASALQRAGWHKVSTVGRGENRRTIYRPNSQGLTGVSETP
jgi:predicted P-loop ATPase